MENFITNITNLGAIQEAIILTSFFFNVALMIILSDQINWKKEKEIIEQELKDTKYLYKKCRITLIENDLNK